MISEKCQQPIRPTRRLAADTRQQRYRDSIQTRHMATLRQKLTTEILEIPGVSEKFWEERTDGFSALEMNGKEFAHFHNDSEIDVRLTRQIIKANGLVHPGDSERHPNRSVNSPWIELRFFDQQDVKKICDLINQLLVS